MAGMDLGSVAHRPSESTGRIAAWTHTRSGRTHRRHCPPSQRDNSRGLKWRHGDTDAPKRGMRPSLLAACRGRRPRRARSAPTSPRATPRTAAATPHQRSPPGPHRVGGWADGGTALARAGGGTAAPDTGALVAYTRGGTAARWRPMHALATVRATRTRGMCRWRDWRAAPRCRGAGARRTCNAHATPMRRPRMCRPHPRARAAHVRHPGAARMSRAPAARPRASCATPIARSCAPTARPSAAGARARTARQTIKTPPLSCSKSSAWPTMNANSCAESRMLRVCSTAPNPGTAW